MGGKLATEQQRADMDATQRPQRPERGQMEPKVDEGIFSPLNEVSAETSHSDIPFYAGQIRHCLKALSQ